MTDTTFATTAAISSVARVQAEKAKSYLSQLCKHFGHKAPVELEERRGRITFSAGVVDLELADDHTLMLAVAAPDHEKLATVEDVIERHLKRFAFKEELSVRWVREV